MSWLNHILWLKCRLTERAYSQSQGTLAATAAMLVFAFTGMFLFSVFLAVQLLVQPQQQARELLHIVLGGVYLFWLTFPLFGYRVNESLDVSRLFLYPVSGFAIFLASFLGNLLELSTVLVYPIFVAIAVAVAPSWELVPTALTVLGIFLLHTVAASQLLLSLLLNTLKDRRTADRMMVFVPLMMALGVWAFEFGLFFAGAGDALLKLDISSWSVWIPSGMIAETLWALSRSDWNELTRGVWITAGITAITIFLAARASEWLMTRGDSGAQPAKPTRLESPDAARRFERFARAIGHSRVAAVALKEIKLLVREPQVRLVLVLFLLMYSGGVAAGVLLTPAGDRDVLIPTVGFSLVFFFAGLVFNIFSLERTGLRFLLIAPVHPLVVIVGKNLGYWLFISGLMVIEMCTMALLFGTSPGVLGFNLLAGQALLVTLMAVGNVVSVLSPYRLPSKGLLHQHRLSFGQMLWISFVGMIGLSVATMITTGGWLILLPPLVTGKWKGLVEAVPICAVYIGGAYCLSTLLAAMLLRNRGEKILEAVVD